MKQTNMHSSSLQMCRNLPPEARANKWTNFTLNEINRFVACLLNMNIIRELTIASYWFTCPSQTFSWFSNMFTRNQSQRITKILPAMENLNIIPALRFSHSQTMQTKFFDTIMFHTNN
jgi:hypothetical protein